MTFEESRSKLVALVEALQGTQKFITGRPFA